MEPRKFCPLSAPGPREVMCNDACAWYDVSAQKCIMQGIAQSLEDLSSNMDLLERKMEK